MRCRRTSPGCANCSARPRNAGTALRARSPGYVLDVSAGELDAIEFERLAAAGGADEDHDAVAARLTDALRLLARSCS